MDALISSLDKIYINVYYKHLDHRFFVFTIIG